MFFLVTACERRQVDTTWHDEAGHRWRALDVAENGRPGFTLLAPSATGVSHRNDVDPEHALGNRNLLIGAGAAVGDIDGDGLPDVFLASVEKPAALYRNTGAFHFVDITASSGIATGNLATTSAAFADLNGDGKLDLVAGTLGGPLKLWLGDGAGHFADATAASGLDSGYAATTITIADADGDGALDLYVGTYKTHNALDAIPPQQRAFDQVVQKVGTEYKVLERWTKEWRIENHPELGGIVRSQRAEPDLFYVNDGHGKFRRVPQSGPRFRDEQGRPIVGEPDYFTLASRFYDVNGDGAPDLYVCNDFEDPDQFWLNDGKGNFRLAPPLSVRETSNTCMSVDFGDIDRDGHVDFFTADMMSPTLAQRQRQFATNTPMPKRAGLTPDRQQWMRNALQLNRGDGTWASIADFAGVSATDWTWGSAFLDVDLDGYEDLVAMNGHYWDVRDADTFERLRNSFPRVAWNREQGEFPHSITRSVVFRNNRDLTFSDLSAAWGMSDDAVSQGIALGDLDGDGDQDVIVTRLNAPPAVYRNNSSAPRVLVRLVGQGANTQAIGAKVTLRPGKTAFPVQSREITAGGYYLSGSDASLTFAMPDSASADVSIEVRWRNGSVSRVEHAVANRAYVLTEASAVASTAASPSASATLFQDATSLLGGHTHVDSAFDDYARQPLLPNKFSQLGPGVTWTDADGDDRPDLVVGTGRGGRLALLRNTDRGFVATYGRATATADLTTLLAVPDGRGGTSIVAGQSNYETGSPAEALAVPAVISYANVRGLGNADATTIKAGDSASVGPLALADVDGDGRLDLFVGARVVPSVWPLPATSRVLLRQADGSWAPDAANAAAVARLGLVSAALFTDLDGDGWPELVVTSEWGPVRVLHNDKGRLRDATTEWGLTGMTSRWNGLAAGDFDGDGRMDLVVTSWGRNTPWRASPDRPYELVAGRFGASGGLGLIFARRDSITGKEMPLESFARVGLAVPSARERIASFADYSKASVSDLLGEQGRSAIRIGATTFDHTLLLNRGGKFEARALPGIAQLSPAFAAVVADFDGDGHEDVFLAQNFSPTEIETPRFDAGAGLLLRGDGRGALKPLRVAESGVRVLGDGRGAAAADYDRDGRVDLAVSQNGAATTLWHNVAGTPGLRVRLNAGVDNPFGIGAQLRVNDGPVREIHAGSGYWSVDDPVTVLAIPQQPTTLWIRWPGGREQRVSIIAGQRAVTVVRP